MWWKIDFADGRDTYVCKDMKDFQRMSERFELELVKEGHYKASFGKKYYLIGFKKDKVVMNREYLTKSGALRSVNKFLIHGMLDELMLRVDTFYLNNSEELEISSSAPIVSWVVKRMVDILGKTMESRENKSYVF